MASAETIRTNVLPESNTAALVGQFLKDVVARMQDADLTGKMSELEASISEFIKANSHQNAYTEDYLEVRDFALASEVVSAADADKYAAMMSALNKWLDGCSFSYAKGTAYIGRCKLLVSGANVECCNFLCGWGERTGVQIVHGPVTLSDGKTLRTSASAGYNVYARNCSGGAWDGWQQVCGGEIIENIDRAQATANKAISGIGELQDGLNTASASIDNLSEIVESMKASCSNCPNSPIKDEEIDNMF